MARGHRRHIQALPRTWDWRFDTGNMGSVSEEAGKIRFTPRLLSPTGTAWGWLAVRSDQLGGKTPHFLAAHTNKYLTFSGEMFGVWARELDTDNWYVFDNVSRGASDFEIYNNGPFPNGPIYIAANQPYPFSRSERLTREWLKDTRSSKLTIGQDTRRSSGDGATVPALPYLGLKITNGGANTKNKCILVSGQHPRETCGRFALEGAVNWLLAGSAEAEFLLDWFDFYVYPCVNPTGVFAGYPSGNPEIQTQHNDVTAGFDDLDAFTASMTTETSGDIEVGVDFHGYMGSGITARGIWYSTAAAIAAAFEAAYLTYDATYTEEQDTTAALLSRWWETDLSAALSVNLENGMTATRTIANFKTSGENTLKTVTKLHAQGQFTNGPGVGSRDFNGTTDRIDWSNVFNTAGSAITISAWIYLDTLPGAGLSEYIFCTHRSGDAAFATAFGPFSNTGALTFFRSGTTLLVQTSAASVISTGSWIHVLVTHDGVMTTFSSCEIFVNGTETAYNTGSQTNGASEYAATGRWSVGGRYYDDARNVDGKIAQLGVWNRVLNSTEIANLAAGYAPDLAAASDLQFYFKGNTSSLVASPGGTGTADGTTSSTGVGNGPAIIYG
jgi:hypothetical protein